MSNSRQSKAACSWVRMFIASVPDCAVTISWLSLTVSDRSISSTNESSSSTVRIFIVCPVCFGGRKTSRLATPQCDLQAVSRIWNLFVQIAVELGSYIQRERERGEGRDVCPRNSWGQGWLLPTFWAGLCTPWVVLGARLAGLGGRAGLFRGCRAKGCLATLPFHPKMCARACHAIIWSISSING